MFDPAGFHEPEDIAELARKNPEDVAAYQQALQEKQARRLAPTSHREFDSQGPMYDQRTQQLSPQGLAARSGTLGGMLGMNQAPMPQAMPGWSSPWSYYNMPQPQAQSYGTSLAPRVADWWR